MPFLFNPWRASHRSRRQARVARLLAPVTRLGLAAGFTNIDYAYLHGDAARLHLGERCSTMNTFFNLVSGTVTVGDDTLFSHNCQVLTGVHRFYEGRRAGLHPDAPFPEVPLEGNDIRIGARCFIGAGAIILAGVSIGDDVIVGAGAVVTADVPSGCFCAGVPARVVRRPEAPLAAVRGSAE